MGFDQRLEWIGKISKDEKALFEGREAYPRRTGNPNDYEIYLYDLGIQEIHKKDFDINKHKYIKPFLTPVKMMVKETDWDRIKKDCNVSENETLWGLGPNHVKFGVTKETSKEFRINVFGGEYDILVERVLLLYHSIELYRWRNHYDIQNLFDNTYPDVYDEHNKNYEMEYDGFYPIDTLFEEMKRLDAEFAERYCGITQNVFYNADW